MKDALPSPGSNASRDRRYRNGSRSCPGAAFSRLVQFKAEAINRAVLDDDDVVVSSVRVLDNKSFADFHIHSRA